MHQVARVDAVYELLSQRSVAADLRAFAIASTDLAQAEGGALLALHQAILHVLDGLLSELGEHGLANLEGVELPGLSVAAMVDHCARASKAIDQLRAAGVESESLISSWVGSWMVPIGSRDWLAQTRLGLSHHQAPDWVSRITERLGDRQHLR